MVRKKVRDQEAEEVNEVLEIKAGVNKKDQQQLEVTKTEVQAR
jgi:hypothetical protein